MLARHTLGQLLAAHGRALCEDPRRLEALLRDLCGECRKEVFVLVSALRERVVVDLSAWPAGVPQALLLARLSVRLADDLGFSPEVARWAVETWAAALAEVPSPDDLLLPPDLALTPLDKVAGAPSAVALAGHASDRPPPSAGGLGHVPPRLPVALQGVLRVASEPGRADFTSIADAVRHAEPGMRVEVSPGVYAEGIVLDRQVEIVAAPPDADTEGASPDSPAPEQARGQSPRPGQGQVVVEAVETSCLRMETAYAVVRGIVLRGRAGPEHRTRFAVDVPQGQLLLEDCEVTSDALACVAVRGRTANPVLRRCHVHDGKGSGVFVHHGGRATLEDCAIVGHALAGVEVGSHGHPTLRRCIILDGRGPGVYVSLGGGGTFEACVIAGNGGAGVEVGWQGAPVVRACHVTRNGGCAVRLHAGAGGTFEQCDLSGNAQGAWDIADGRMQHIGTR